MPSGPASRNALFAAHSRHELDGHRRGPKANLRIVDGSVFPTGLGANPSLTIYALAARQASALK
ncbi:MAG TPA: GMC oxidoreductase [Burkholderiales bacterium]|nr:GMC oxidoreductase [Burkholderiales bacterium]